jgi:hypothetical protein
MLMLSLGQIATVGNLDQARTFMKRELIDVIVLFQFIIKAFGQERQIWDQIVNETIQIIYKAKKQQINYL